MKSHNKARCRVSRIDHPRRRAPSPESRWLVVVQFAVAAMSPSPLRLGNKIGGEDTAATKRPNRTTTLAEPTAQKACRGYHLKFLSARSQALGDFGCGLVRPKSDKRPQHLAVGRHVINAHRAVVSA